MTSTGNIEMLRIGAILHTMSGSKENADKYYGRTIQDISVGEEECLIKFTDGVAVRIWDNGQSCCESRYMKCDDDPSNLIGANLINIAVKEAPDIDDGGECHEQVFIEIQTDKGLITLNNHNEHNGYYGGFGLDIEEIKQGVG